MDAAPDIATDFAGTDDSNPFEWEPRVALDCCFREFAVGFREKPTQKPILLFLPKEGPAVLLAAILGFISDGVRKTVCLFEDAEMALSMDSIKMPDRVQKTTRIVIGDLKSLAKTDKGCYGGCVVLAYGVPMPLQNEREHVMYLDDKTGYIAQLCGWSAHLLYLDQPFRDTPDDILEEMKENLRARNIVCEMSSAHDMGVLGSKFRAVNRRATLVFTSSAGTTRSAASCVYVQLFRLSGGGSYREMKGVPATIFTSEQRAIKFYENGEAGDSEGAPSPCWFMKKPMYDKWVAQKTEKESAL